MADQELPPALASDERFSILCDLLQESLDGIDINAMLVYLVDLMKPSILPHLADQFSLMDEVAWLLAESDDAKRNLIKSAAELHRFKGTPWAIREVFRVLGFGEIRIDEGVSPGADSDSVWSLYRVALLERVITNEQAAMLRRLLLTVAPARCRLVDLDYQAVPLRYNGLANYDGQYNHGSSN
ncbi:MULTISPECIES: phage tail protein [unclassified Pseudomonas]|uniref:phage tail protein n=1 Tax=unclassified Pseudomonas TaxID=196821 RepID=UPI001A9E0D43|nr:MULTISPECIES: phage tail protein [unclassified Pseudomonas]